MVSYNDTVIGYEAHAHMPQFEFVGVDGCPYGWFSVGFTSIHEYELKTFRTFRCLLDYYSGARLILVDIPIGLPERSEGRTCDTEARKMLGKRGSSGFPTPTRSTVEYVAKHPGDFQGAKDQALWSSGKSISRQTFAISPKIAQVDETLLSACAGEVRKVREVHPEVLFWALNDRKPMKFKKKERGRKGIDNRICVLEPIEGKARRIYDEACSKFFRKDVGRDDILDALAAAVTARQEPEQLQKFPKDPPRDGRSLPMEMVFWIPNHRDKIMREDT